MEPLARTVERRSSASSARLTAVVAEVPPASASAVARALAGEAARMFGSASPSVMWVPRGAEVDDAAEEHDTWSFVGWGVAARADGAQEERFAEVQSRAERVWGRIERGSALPVAPRLFGGFAFDAGAAVTPQTELGRAWAPFGDATFVLPRLLHGCCGDRAFLAAFGAEAEAAALIEDARRALESAQLVFNERGPGRAPSFEDGNERSWIDIVSAALAEIERRSFGKVVPCRTRRVSFAREADLVRAFALLEERHRTCARFLFEHGGVTFLGASPERLLLVRGRRVVTEALAGSLPRRADRDAEQQACLLASEKDRAEHAFVVDAIRSALSPLCAALSVPSEPHVRTLPHVHHLATPITALLRDRATVLDLAASLHPTPAICGTPRAEARAFLLAHEREPRGWYGGGTGWLDASGDGEIAVALRSALAVRRTAWIYAGAGIVSGSDPAKEYVETTIKERAMREALEAAA